jgi:hypothetical protein
VRVGKNGVLVGRVRVAITGIGDLRQFTILRNVKFGHLESCFHDKLLFLFTLNYLIIYIYLFSPGHLFISSLCHGFVGLKTFCFVGTIFFF